MLLKKSRYQKARFFEPQGEKGIFAGVRTRNITTLEGVIEHEVKDNDRLDQLARHYFNDDRLWYRIADANPSILFSNYLFAKEMVGQVILIPKRRK